MGVARREGGGGEMGESGQKVQTSNMYNVVTII